MNRLQKVFATVIVAFLAISTALGVGVYSLNKKYGGFNSGFNIAQPYRITNADSGGAAATTTEFFGDVNPQVDNLYTLGSITKRWKNIFTTGGVSSSGTSSFTDLLFDHATGTNIAITGVVSTTKLIVKGGLTGTPVTVTGGTIGGQFTNAGGVSVTLADGSAGSYGLKTAYDIAVNSVLVSASGGLSTLSGSIILSPSGTPQLTVPTGGGLTSAGTVTSTFAGPVSSTKLFVDHGGLFQSNGTSTMGPYLFTTDSGAITAMDMDVTSAAANEQQMSYDFNIDGNPFLQMFSLADAAGSIKATSTAVRTFQPLQLFSSYKEQRTEVDTATYTFVYPGDYYLAVSSTSQAVTITFPSATSTLSGTKACVKDRKGNAGVNNITVTSTVGVTFDGASSKVINSAYGKYCFINDGVSNWEID
ncbi:MAG: hypothetical protein WC776_04860 [Patescibacteria group bacterium]|jgi:hypothetical protein